MQFMAELTTKESTAYKYEALDTDVSIRLLQLEPEKDAEACVVTINIIHVTLDQNPDYEALSYTWGEPIFDQLIQIGRNSHLLVTENLMRALKRLRHHTERRTLWIDQICIDQSNVKERSHQVTLMRRIYQQARETLVWLGEETEEIRNGW